MSKNKITYTTPTNEDQFNAQNEVKDRLESKPATVEVALNLPGDESVKEIINVLNGDPVGTPVEILEMDWA